MEKRRYNNIWAGYPATPFSCQQAGQVYTVLSIVYDPDLGTIAEVRTPDGHLAYGYDGSHEEPGA